MEEYYEEEYLIEKLEYCENYGFLEEEKIWARDDWFVRRKINIKNPIINRRKNIVIRNRLPPKITKSSKSEQ